MKSPTLFVLLLLSILSIVIQCEDEDVYEDEVEPGGMVSGSWSIGGYDSSSTYECSGIAGATDC